MNVKKLFTLSSGLSLMLLLVSPGFLIINNSQAEIRQEGREGRNTQSIRDRQVIVCGQDDPTDPRAPRGEDVDCPQEPTAPPSEPTSPPAATPTPAVGGPAEPTATPRVGEAAVPTVTPVPGVEGAVIAAVADEKPTEAPEVLALADTSSGVVSGIELVRLSSVLWIMLSGKSVLAVRQKRKRT